MDGWKCSGFIARAGLALLLEAVEAEQNLVFQANELSVLMEDAPRGCHVFGGLSGVTHETFGFFA